MEMSPRSRLEKSHAHIEAEIQAERAAALRRIGGRLAELLEELGARRDRRACLSGEAREREREACRTLAAEARLYRWYLEVQREALGLRNHSRLDEAYPVPRDAGD